MGRPGSLLCKISRPLPAAELAATLCTVSLQVSIQTNTVPGLRDRCQQSAIPPVAQDPHDVHADIFKCFPDSLLGHVQSIDETKDILHSECFGFLAFVFES